jgi:hypothetical protein
MANPVIRVLSDAGTEVLFDSWNDDVLFHVGEQLVQSGHYTNRQAVFTYPALAGRKIMAYLDTPYGGGSLDAWLIPSCRVSYSSGIPVVTVAIDNTRTDLPIADAMLTVMLSGVSQ